MTRNQESQWTEQQDLLLGQTILTHLENNGTQLEGFQAAALILQRTPAACGFRWNKEVRKQFSEQLQRAKEKKAEIKGLKPQREVREKRVAPAQTQDVIAQVTQLIERLVAENKDLKVQVEKRDGEIAKLTHVLQRARESIDFSEALPGAKRKSLKADA